MKKILCLWVLTFFLAAGICRAENPSPYGIGTRKPEPTAPSHVAMLFYKLTAQMPDLDSWARQTQAYKNASNFDQPAVLKEQTKRLMEDFSLQTFQEPVVVEIPVQLSKYNAVNQGFFIEDFKADTFFPVRFDSQAYAIVPQGIVDRQWLEISDKNTAKAIEAAAGSNGNRLVRMTLLLTPQYADKDEPLAVDGEKYWLIAASIKKMMIYPGNEDTLLWESEDAATKAGKSLDLLNLYQ